MIWRCPQCRGGLAQAGEELACMACAARYPCVAGIPDLRIERATWIDFERDREAARELVRASEHEDVEGLVRRVFARRAGWSDEEARRRTREVLRAPDKFLEELGGPLAPCVAGAGPFLDLGCGAGALLVAGARLGREGIGVDVCLEWLVVAQRWLTEAGARPQLAAGLAEALPLADGAVSGVTATDVLEHVGDPAACAREVGRVLRPGGRFAFVTPNRFSLTPEPHVGVLGVGWLPSRFRKRYVRWRSGKDYEFVELVSPWRACRILRSEGGLDCRAEVVPIPAGEIGAFGPMKARLALAYNRIVGSRALGRICLAICPMFQVRGVKSARP